MECFRTLLVLVVVGVCAVDAHDCSHIDYMKLNRKNMPHMQMLVQGALNCLDIGMGSSEKLKKKFRRNGFFPTLRTRVSYSPESLVHTDWVEYESVNYDGDYASPPSSPPTREYTYGAYSQTGYDSSFDWGVYLTWDLTDLIYSYEESQVLSRKSAQASQIRRRTVDVGRRYALLMAALPVDETEEADPDAMVAILENASILDEWTGGMLSLVLENMECKRHADEMATSEEAKHKSQSVAKLVADGNASSSGKDPSATQANEKRKMIEFLNGL